MKRQEVNVIGRNETWEQIMVPEAYSYDPKRPAPWLQKLCLRILRKLGCHHYEPSMTVNKYVIEGNELLDKIFEQDWAVCDILERRPSKMYIGAEDFHEFMQQGEPEGCFQFQQEYGLNREIIGLPVEVVPWMRGILLVP